MSNDTQQGGTDNIHTLYDSGNIKWPVSVCAYLVSAGSPNVLQAVDPTHGLPISVLNASLAVTGTFWQATQPISAASLPLPSGAATSGNQGTANASLSSIDGKLPALGQALAAACVPVVLTAAQIATLTPPAAITGFATLAEQQTQTTYQSRIAGKYVDYDSGAGTDSVVAVGFLLPASGGAVIGGTSANPIRTDTTGTTTQPVSATSLPLPTNAAAETGGNLAAIAASLNVMDDWDETDRAKVNVIAGQVGITGGAGAVAANTPRHTLASDDPAVVALGTVNTNLGTLLTTTDFDTKAGSLTETAPTTDTASSGLNGRLQRLAQRLTSLIALIPAALTGSGNFKTAISEAIAAGTNLIGKTGIDQTTPGTTNAVVASIASAQTLATVTTVTAVTAITNALPAGTNALGSVNVAPTTAGGWTAFSATSADGSTALTATAQAVKASAGKLGGWFIYNPNATATYVIFYNTAQGSVTVGTTNPLFAICIPATSAANIEIANGIAFSTAISVAATTTGGGNTAPSTALEFNCWYV